MGAYGLPRVGIRKVFCLMSGVRSGLNIPLEDVSEAERQSLPTKAGSMVMFSNMTPHGSRVNHTDTIRWSMDSTLPSTWGNPRDVGMSPVLSPGVAQILN